MRNDWETDPFGDPVQTGGNPWSAAPGATPDITQPDLTGSEGSSSWMMPMPEGTLSAPTQTSASPAPDTYDAHLSTVAQAGDPASRASAQDDLARQLQADLEADGHAIKWNGASALTIDGRAYELGDGGGQGVTDPTVQSPTPAPNPSSPSNDTPWVPDGQGSWMPPPEQAPPGKHWDPHMANWVDNAPASTTTSAGGRMDDNAVLAQIAQWAQMPGADPTLASNPQYWLKAIQSRDGLGSFNMQYWQDAAVGPNAFYLNPGREAGGGAQTQPGAAAQPPGSPWTYPAWSPTAPTYTPNFIDASASELPGYDDIMKALDTPGAGDAELQKLVQGIVEHPETLSDQDVERLKAQSAEEAAVAGQAQDEELQHFGYNAGLDSSPWLAGQRAQNAWDRRSSTIGANRNIDIAAADRRSADRTSAAQIGTAYSSFQSSKKAQAVGLAVTAALGKAGEQRSRTQLNESLKQAATQLGLTKDNLVMTYLSHAMDDLTKNKQIDLNFDVDMKKLAEQSDEFKQTLLQRIAEMTQQDNQFTANYGLAVQEFQHKKDQDAWDRAKSTVGT